MKIMIADDHTMVRRGLRMLLGKLFKDSTVEGAGSVQELLDRIVPDDPPDVILLDLLMPGMNGLDGLEEVCRKVPDVPVAIISAWEEVDDVIAAIQRGAKGFILKSSDENVLKLAISLILSGETYLPSHVMSHLKANGGRQGVGFPIQFASDNPLSKLTNREKDVLQLLMNGASNKEIGRNLNVVEGTIKKHLRDIFRKLDVSNRTRVVIKAAELGWHSEKAGINQERADT